MADTGKLLDWAAWTSLNSGIVSLAADWRQRRRPKLLFGRDRLPLRSLVAEQPAQFARDSGYCCNSGRIQFVQRVSLLSGTDWETAGVFLAGPFNDWENAAGNTEWQLTAAPASDGQPVLSLDLPLASLPTDAPFPFKFITGTGRWINVCPSAPNSTYDPQGFANYRFDPQRTGRHRFRFTTPLPLNLAAARPLMFEHDSGECEEILLQPGVFLKTLDSQLPLGAAVLAGGTRFRLFAPRARAVYLFLYPKPDSPGGDPVALHLVDTTTWEVVVPGDHEGWGYHFQVDGEAGTGYSHFDAAFPILDPWARCVAGPHGPAIVIADSAFGRDRSTDFTPPAWHDLVVVEAHVRDLTAAAPIPLSTAERAGFSGLRAWIDDAACYLRQLGVNAVEFQPVHQFDTVDPAEYAWGYMPVNYFAPATQYALDPTRQSQIREFQEVVAACHRAGMAVLLDVVYNHVGEPNFLQFIDKQYYFLLDETGDYLNYSGCGNTLDANTPMVRRLIRDSLIHWLRAYGVDGFRFDLGELLGVDTLAWLETELKAVKPSVILIAEPWSFRGHIAGALRATGWASWNDGFREQVRAYICGTGHPLALAHAIGGSFPDWSRFAAQTVNYLESHDDHCWIDKITTNPGGDGSWPSADDIRRTHLAAAVLMVSLGVPMLSSGMDFLKSKGGVRNTYLDGERNALPYPRMAQFAATHCYYRHAVHWRLGPWGRLVRVDGTPSADYLDVIDAQGAALLIINADRTAGSRQLLFAINPGRDFVRIGADDLDLHGFAQVADTERWVAPGEAALPAPHYPLDGGHVLLPPLSCGLWQRDTQPSAKARRQNHS
jgi:pullulanase